MTRSQLVLLVCALLPFVPPVTGTEIFVVPKRVWRQT